MGDKKGFFDLLSPKSALLVGLLGGFMSLCTIGFFVLAAQIFGNGGSATVVAPVVADSLPAQAPTPVVVKSEKPKVELFVMSYCPFGLQMEKAYLPAWQLLKDKADIDIKFVSYAMHGKKEVDENTRQYCIQGEQPTKFASYLQCFFAAGQNDGSEADYKSCLTKSGVNTSKLNSCMTKTDKQFGITAKFNDQGSWLSGRFPLYPIHDGLNQKYGVQGSPTLVINDQAVNDVGRTPEAVKQAICAAFNNAPAECGQPLNSAAFDPGFGLTVSAGGAAAAAAGCAT